MTFENDLWKDDQWAMPQRIGPDVGGAKERAMQSVVGGYQGIRTVEFQNHDGSITTMRTRGGWPEFETRDGQLPSIPPENVDYVFGFVAWTGSRAVLFNPYTLAELDPNYLLAGKLYTVQDFETDWNRPITPDYDWFDVALFDSTKVRINAKWMEDLLTTVTGTFPSIPYIINRGLTLDQYGDAGRNSTEKRVFEVGRYSVYSHGGGGVTETLTPTAPRTDSKAMTIGQRLDYATDKAWLGQLYFSGPTWSDMSSAWSFSQAEVTMTLTAPYLSKVNSSATVDLAIATLGAAVPTSGSVNDPVTLPTTPIALIGAPVIGPTDTFPARYGYFTSWVEWPWSSTENRQLSGAEVGSYTGEDRIGSASNSIIQAGRTLTYTADNIKQWKTKTFVTQYNAQTFSFGASGPVYTDVILEWTGATLNWGSSAPTTANRGSTERVFTATTINMSTAIQTSETQTGIFKVESAAVVLVELDYSQNKTSGQGQQITGNPTAYDSQMGGMNEGSQYIGFRPYSIPVTPPPSAASVVAQFTAMQAAWGAQTVRHVPSYPPQVYYASVVAITPTINASLSWTTRDYLLYDETNGVFISIVGQYTGSQSAAGNATTSLTVTLRIQTRHHVTTKTLLTVGYSPGTLLIEKTVGGGKFAVPSPQIRAIFAPLYQEQGSFKGAHYVELSEENNGADPAHLFNFNLYLKTYAGIGTVNADNNGNANVYFIPCNLLEMCYGWIFSDEYGVSVTGDRYPINYTTRYNNMINDLFTTPFRVSVRDGAETNWSNTFGADFAAIDTVSLHRT